MTQSLFANPTLSSVLMVEDAIRSSDGALGRYQLWRTLPRKMTYQTFQHILAYLEENGKILTTPEGRVLWTWNPQLIAHLRKEQVKLY